MAVDWSTEWYTSTFWILGVTIAAALGSWLIGWLLTRSTVWGRQFARLAFPYFAPSGPEGWRPLLTALGVLALAIASVRLAVLNSYINSGLFTALQELDAAAFTRYIGIFAVLSVGFLTQALLAFYAAAAGDPVAGLAQRSDRRRLAQRHGLPPRPRLGPGGQPGPADPGGRPVLHPAVDHPRRRRGRARWCRWCRSR